MGTDYGDGIPEEPSRPNPAWKIAMVGAPIFLLLSTGWALWIWWKKSQDDSIDPRLALASVAAEVEELVAEHLQARHLAGNSLQNKGG